MSGGRPAARMAHGLYTVRTAWGRGLPLRPREELVERRTEGLAPLGQVVLDLWRHLWVDDPRNDAVALELPKLLDQHLLRDGRNRALEIREAQLPAPEEMEQDHELPSAFQHPDRLDRRPRQPRSRTAVDLTDPTEPRTILANRHA